MDCDCSGRDSRIGWAVSVGMAETVTAIRDVASGTTVAAFTYDAMGRMKTVLESGVLQCTYNYDATKIEPLSKKDWYYYEVNFDEWKIRNKE